jgi:hypothetical protein
MTDKEKKSSAACFAARISPLFGINGPVSDLHHLPCQVANVPMVRNVVAGRLADQGCLVRLHLNCSTN